MFTPGFLLARHSSKHASTGVTPFEAMYGRKAKLPQDPKSPVQLVDGKPTFDAINEESLTNYIKATKSLHSFMETKITAAQKRQKKNYDLKYDNSNTFEIGSEVYMKNP